MVPNPSYLGVLGKLSLAERTKSSTWGDFKKYLSFPHNRSQRMGGAGSVLKMSALELSSMAFFLVDSMVTGSLCSSRHPVCVSGKNIVEGSL